MIYSQLKQMYRSFKEQRNDHRLHKDLLKKAVEQNLPSEYVNENFPCWQLETILQRHAAQLDISMYNEPCLEWEDREISDAMAAVSDYKRQISMSAAATYGDNLEELSADLKYYYCGGNNLNLKDQIQTYLKLSDLEFEYDGKIEELDPARGSDDLHSYQYSLLELKESLKHTGKEYLPDHVLRYHQTDGYRKNPAEYAEFIQQQLQLHNRAIELICDKCAPLIYDYMSPAERKSVQKGETYQHQNQKKTDYTTSVEKNKAASNKARTPSRKAVHL